MLKLALLGGAMIIAAPVVAQDRGNTGDASSNAPATQQMQSAMPEEAMRTGDGRAAVPNGAAQAAPAPQPAGGDQIAAIVEAEFATYDKNANGTLEKAEFAAWMDALKAKAPNAAAKPSDPKWNDAAFVQADTDKSSSVTKQELAGFLGSASGAGKS